jgi:hypothetical protein
MVRVPDWDATSWMDQAEPVGGIGVGVLCSKINRVSHDGTQHSREAGYTSVARGAPRRHWFCAFDLLWFDDGHSRACPFWIQKALLGSWCPCLICPMLYVEHVPGDGARLCLRPRRLISKEL